MIMATKILIVDDDLETLRLVGLMLQRQGYQIIAATSGAQAITSAKNELPDLVLLDVMMPDMDGYEVTRQLRGETATMSIPILMFTAKSQVEDKVTGFEAGVDDYLTKPTHPAELMAHVKALISRTAKGRTPSAPQATEYGRLIAVLSAKGGIGISTLALNTALGLVKRGYKAIAAEFNPGHGSWGIELGLPTLGGLERLLRMKPSEINDLTVEKELIAHDTGLRMLLAANHFKDSELNRAVPQMEAILKFIAVLSQVVLLDIGANHVPGLDALLSHCHEALIAVEPNPVTATRTKMLIEYVNEAGFGKSRPLTIVMVNRLRVDVQLSLNQVQETLGLPVSQIILPAPELAYQSMIRYKPLITIQPDGLTAQQYLKVSELLAQRLTRT
jgi:pilus assembly protein CpaE